MIKPVIPVSRLRPFFGQPPTTGIPSRVFGGLRVCSRTTRRFVAGAIVALGTIPEVSGDIHNTVQKVVQVRNDKREGRVVNFGIPQSAKVQTTSPIRGIKIYQVRNDRRNGAVYYTRIATHFKLEPHIIIFRKPLTAVSRLRPWFGQLPPLDIVQSDARKFGDFKVVQRFNNRTRNGYVVNTGPQFSHATTTSKSIIGLKVVKSRDIVIGGKANRILVPRSSFFLAVDKIPGFKVVYDSSAIRVRSPKGSVHKFLPKNTTSTIVGSFVIYRGFEVVTFGQKIDWTPRRPNVAVSTNIPKPIRIVSRQNFPNLGHAQRLDFPRVTVPNALVPRFKIPYVKYYHLSGKVITITPFKRNPPGSGSLNHGLIRLSNFRIALSVKRENDGGRADVFSADASGTVINFNKPFKIVESITVTALSTALQTPIYDFTHSTQNPTTFLVKLFDSSGTRINGTVSWKARGIL